MTNRRAFTLRAKLTAGFAAAVLLFASAGWIGIVQLKTVDAVAQEIRERWTPRQELLAEIKQHASEHRLLSARRIQTRNFRELAALARETRAVAADLRGAKAAYNSLVSFPEERVLVDAFGRSFTDYEAAMEGIFQRLEAGDLLGAASEFDTTAMQAHSAAIGTLEQLLSAVRQRSSDAVDGAKKVYHQSVLRFLTSLAISIVLLVATIAWFSRKVTLPLGSISAAMRRLNAGDTSTSDLPQASWNDEIGDLARAVGGFRTSLLRSHDLARLSELDRTRLDAAINNMPVGLCMFDAELKLIVANDCYRRMYNLPHESVTLGTPLTALLEHRKQVGMVPEADLEQYTSRVFSTLATGKAMHDMLNLNDGRTISVIIQPVAKGGVVAVHEDVTERRRAEAQIYHMARHDALTDLPNRILFKERLAEILDAAGRDENIAVMCLDLDRFKGVNDTLGHPIGDKLLRMVADRLRGIIRTGDVVARLGGDEFVLVQGKAEQPRSAIALAQRILDTLSAPYLVDGHQIVIGASVGVAMSPHDGADADLLLKNSDMALYRSKNDGRGVFRFFEAEMDARMQQRRSMELDLRRALAERQFELHYQPLISVEKNAVTGFEALLRWKHPDQGYIPPSDFIPLAEEIGLINPLGEWILQEACTEAATWPEDIHVAVNLSPVQFRSKKLLATVLSALAVSGLSPRRLELEITEGVLLVEQESTLSMLHDLRALGVRIAMDDFGTGYSSLGYLQIFPFDKIKIDSSFIRNSAKETTALAIIRAITGLSTSLGMMTTAEGVETADQLKLIREEGCGEAQGYLFSRARPASEIAEFLESFKQRKAA
jgi:diguanylate cyclase (GGDEF)-like protein